MLAHELTDRFPRAMTAAAVVTAMAVPRIMAGGIPLWAAVPVAFMAMTFIALGAMSWGGRAGMHGLMPERQMLWPGLWAALVLGFAMAFIAHLYVDPMLRTALLASAGPRELALRYPVSLAGGLALVLWVAGFETMFFQAGAMSFFSRLTDHRWLVIFGAVAFRTLVTSLQLARADIVDAFPLFLVQSAATSAVACILFARAGLPAAMLFSALVSSHVFLPRASF